MNKILCIDPSMNSTAVTFSDDQSICFAFFSSFEDYAFKKKSFSGNSKCLVEDSWIKPVYVKRVDCSIAYYDALTSSILEICSPSNGPVNVVMEGYSYRSIGRNFNIGEFIGILKYKIYVNKFNLFIVSPSQVKKFIYKGNASKDEMFSHFVRTSFYIKYKKYVEMLFSYFADKKTGCMRKNDQRIFFDIMDSFYIFLYAKTHLCL